MKAAWQIFLRIFGGFELAVATLFLMTLLTLLGTLNQVDEGLFVSQSRYFESYFVVHRVWAIGIPLPGGITLMALLFVNLVVGGVLRMRKGVSTIGILVTHLGILLLLIAGLVKLTASTEGNLRLWPGEQGATFSSFHFWEVDVREDLGGGKHRQFLIPHSQLIDLRDGRTRRFESENWPFTLVLSDFLFNAEFERSGPSDLAIDGLRTKRLPRQTEEELNLAALRMRALDKTGETVLSQAFLFGLMPHEHVFQVHGRTFGVILQRRKETMPFTVRLDEFHHEVYPNTMRPKVFSSDVTVMDGEGQRPATIEMNQPLRRDGYILFQSSWGPQGAPLGARKFSVFQVVRNPSDHWPLVACIVIALGLLLHFGVKLSRWMRAERKRALKAAA